MKTVLFRTGNDAVLEKLVVQLSIQLGFHDPNPEYGIGMGWLGLIATEGKKGLNWARVRDPNWKTIDVGSTSTLDLVAALKDILASSHITMPFQIYKQNVLVYPCQKIVIGCVELPAGKIKEIVKAYCPDAALQIPDHPGPDQGMYSSTTV